MDGMTINHIVSIDHGHMNSGDIPWNLAGKWMFIPLKMVLIGIDPYPYFPFLHMFDGSGVGSISYPSTARFWNTDPRSFEDRRSAWWLAGGWTAEVARGSVTWRQISRVFSWFGCGSKWKTDVGPQMWMSSLVLTIQLLGYKVLTHTHFGEETCEISCEISSAWWWLEPWIFMTFHSVGKNHPNWLSYFSEGLKPPTRKYHVFCRKSGEQNCFSWVFPTS